MMARGFRLRNVGDRLTVLRPAPLPPAVALARKSKLRFPNESEEYRRARHALLVEEIELRRQIERVAKLRRDLPPGGLVTGDYQFEGEEGRTDFAGLFGDKTTLVAYSYMFGPERKQACPMCTSVLDAWDGETPHIKQRVAFAIIARSPIRRLTDFKKKRGWHHLPLYRDLNDQFSRDYHALTSERVEIPALSVFTRRDGNIRHFWSGEMTAETADPGQDARGAPDIAPLWTILDMTPEGRGADWYPRLDYGS